MDADIYAHKNVYWVTLGHTGTMRDNQLEAFKYIILLALYAFKNKSV